MTSIDAARIGGVEPAGAMSRPVESHPLWGLALILAEIAARIAREQASEPLNPTAEENRA